MYVDSNLSGTVQRLQQLTRLNGERESEGIAVGSSSREGKGHNCMLEPHLRKSCIFSLQGQERVVVFFFFTRRLIRSHFDFKY